MALSVRGNGGRMRFRREVVGKGGEKKKGVLVYMTMS
jgi:hypothetical protein